MIRSEFSRLLQEALDDEGMSQVDFAEATGFSTKHVNLMLNGKCGWSMAAMEHAAAVLGRVWVIDLKELP